MDSLITAQESAAYNYFSAEFWIVLKFAAPVLVFFLLKDYCVNFLYYIIIRLSTSYQFQNDFVMDNRHCQILEMKFQNVFIIDLDNGEVIQIRNKDFVSRDIWHKPPPRSKWSEDQREAYRKALIEKEENRVKK